MAYGEKN